MTADDLRKAYEQKITTPLEVFERALTVAKKKGRIVTCLVEERGYREAEASTKRWQAGQPLSVLDGIPLVWKDMFDVAYTKTRVGARFRETIDCSVKDAWQVNRMSQAGVVTLGKTNLSELAYSGLGLNPHYGTPINTLFSGADRAPGGSSSGSALAVALGIVPLAVGTDTAGSIRIPAAFNGVVGYRASCKRYSMEGVFPLACSVDTTGPLASTVQDVVLYDSVMTGQQEVLQKKPLVGVRFRLDPLLLEDCSVRPAIASVILGFVKQLEDQGAVIERAPLAAFHETLELIRTQGWIGAAEAFTLHEAVLNSAEANQLDPRVFKRLESARHIRACNQIRLYQACKSLRKKVELELNGALLISPTVGHEAPLLEPLEQDPDLFAEVNLKTLRLTMPGSFLDMPGVSLPCGVGEEGLPVGVLVSAAQGQDIQLLQSTLSIEKVFQNAG